MDSFKSAEDFKEQCGYDIDGVWYPRVTKIVGIKAKPALNYFYASMPNYREAKRMTEQSAEEGTRVHDAVEAFLTGKDFEIDPSIRASFDAFQQFVSDNHIEVNRDFVEYRLHHKEHRYAGTNDAIATIGGKTGVLDIKTSQAIYRDYDLQTAAYIEALLPVLPALETRWILRIDQDQRCEHCPATLRTKGGRAKVRNGYGSRCQHVWGSMRGHVELKESPEWKGDFEAFLAAKRLWEWENEKWLREVGYL